MTEQINDTETDRLTVLQLTPDQFQAHIDGIRERRLRAIDMVKTARKQETAFAYEKARKKFIQQVGLAEKEIKRLDALMDKIQTRIATLQTLILEAGGDLSVFMKTED